MTVIAAGIAICLVFLAFNIRAYDGFFQDDEIDTLGWAPFLTIGKVLESLVSFRFDTLNFRPVGFTYYGILSQTVGPDFPLYVTPLFALHFLNIWLVYLLARKLGVGRLQTFFGVAFFAWTAGAMDAFWKPMYMFDVSCAFFCLLSVLLWMRGRWLLSFVAFWLAYKSKEVAIALPVVLLAYEYFAGQRRYRKLAPFFLVSFSFGLQGMLFNPNKNNDYTFHFTLSAMTKTLSFYSRRFLFFPLSGLLLVALAWVRDRRIWFALAAVLCFLGPILFLPGRMFEAYTYLPLAFVGVALAIAAAHVQPKVAWIVLALWLPWNCRQLYREQRVILQLDDEAWVFVESLNRWAAEHPSLPTLVYDRGPRGYHPWGIVGAWNVAHKTVGLKALYIDSDEARAALQASPVSLARWDERAGKTIISRHSPGSGE